MIIAELDHDALAVWMRTWCADMRERAAQACEAAALAHPECVAALTEVAAATRELELPGAET